MAIPDKRSRSGRRFDRRYPRRGPHHIHDAIERTPTHRSLTLSQSRIATST
jgi:hypothetical protein